MANKQTRRSVSLNRELYKAATAEARRRGITLSELVAESLRAAGVDAPAQWHFTPAKARKTAKAKIVSPLRVLRRIVKLSSAPGGVESRGGGEPRAAETSPVAHRPSLERQMLGDWCANAMGFR